MPQQQQQYTDNDLREILSDPRFQDPTLRQQAMAGLSPVDRARLAVLQGNQQKPGGVAGVARGFEEEFPLRELLAPLSPVDSNLRPRVPPAVAAAPNFAATVAQGVASEPSGALGYLAKKGFGIGKGMVEGIAAESGEAMGDVDARLQNAPPLLRQMFEAPMKQAAGIPVLGPMALRLSDSIMGGDFAEAGGRALGIGGQLVTPGTKARRSAPLVGRGGPVRETLSQRMKPGTMRQSLVEFGETVSSRVLGGVSQFRGFMRQQQDDLINNVINPLIDEVSTVSGMPIAQRTERVMGMLGRAKEAMRTQRDQIFGELRAAHEDFAFINIREAKDSARAHLVQLERRGKSLDGPARRELEAILEMPDIIDLDLAIDRASGLGDLAFVGARDEVTTVARAHLRNVRKQMRDATKRDLAEFSGPEAAAMYEQGMEIAGNLRATFNETVVAKMMQASPEDVPVVLRNMTLDDVEQIVASLPPNLAKEMGALYVQDMFFGRGPTRAITGELSELAQVRGTPGGANLLPSGGTLQKPFAESVTSGRKLRKLVESAGVEKIDAIAGSGVADRLLSIADEAAKIGLEDPRRFSAGIVGGIMNGIILTGAMGAFAGDFSALFRFGPRSAGSVAAGSYIFSRLVTSPEGFTTLRAFVRGTAGPAVLAAQTQRILGDEGIRAALDAGFRAEQQESRGVPLQPGTVQVPSPGGQQPLQAGVIPAEQRNR